MLKEIMELRNPILINELNYSSTKKNNNFSNYSLKAVVLRYFYVFIYMYIYIYIYIYIYMIDIFKILFLMFLYIYKYIHTHVDR